MINKKLLVILLLISTNLYFINSMENAESLFENGCNAYKNEDYKGALLLFEDILSKDIQNFNLYYNIGCCYFKLNQFGKSRFYFERALIYNPFDKELNQNLKLLYSKIMNNSADFEQELMSYKIIFFISIRYMILLFIIFIMLSVILFVFYLVKNNKTMMIFFIIFFSFSVIVSFIFFVQYSEYNKKEAVITSKTADIYLTPYSDSVLQELNEGIKVKVLDSEDEFLKIIINNETIGWAKVSDVITNY